MKRILLSIFLISSGFLGAESMSSSSSASSVPQDARYEIVQSPLALRWTFLLDKWLGNVWQLVKAEDGSSVWQSMKVADLPQVESTEKKARFQIFASGIAAKSTFMLDTQLGSCWQLTTIQLEGKDLGTIWSPMEKD